MKIPFINSFLYINNKCLNILLFYVINMTFMKYIRYVNSYSAKNNHKLLASSNNLILPKLNNVNKKDFYNFVTSSEMYRNLKNAYNFSYEKMTEELKK